MVLLVAAVSPIGERYLLCP